MTGNRTTDLPCPSVEQTIVEQTAANVRAELARRRLTPAELARRLGWSASATSRRLSGQVPLDVAKLAAIARVLGMPAAELLGADNL